MSWLLYVVYKTNTDFVLPWVCASLRLEAYFFVLTVDVICALSDRGFMIITYFKIA